MWERQKSELVRASMTKGVLSIEKDKTVLDAAKLMAELNIGSLLVTEKDKAIGIITERDILSKVTAKELNPEALSVTEIMSSPILRVEADKTVSEALTVMGERGIKHLVVVDEGEVVGMFSLHNLIDLERYRLGVLRK
ncbi:CBS domain-containing protein [Candidatus Bathyarchaeota archaeon]|nr:CBS domain-containing protein [Candidatus Bathyarchaeota archaeon]